MDGWRDTREFHRPCSVLLCGHKNDLIYALLSCHSVINSEMVRGLQAADVCLLNFWYLILHSTALHNSSTLCDKIQFKCEVQPKHEV